MKKKRLLAATLVATAIAAGSAVANAADVSTWDELKTTLQNTEGESNTATLTGNITGGNSVITPGLNSTIDLAGHTLQGSEEPANIYFDGKNLTINNGGTIKDFTSDYGALTVVSGAVVTATVDSLTFDGNKSTSHGAGFYYKDQTGLSNATFNATNITFSNNEVLTTGSPEVYNSGSGAGVFVAGGNVNFYGGENTFTNNSMNGNIKPSRTYKVGGGAVANQSYWNESDTAIPINANMTIGHSLSINTFTGNTSSTNGGAIMNRAVDTDGDATLTIDGVATTFSGNSATGTSDTSTNGCGGAIYNVQRDGKTATVNLNGDATFENNTAANQGGAIYNEGTVNFAEGKTFTFSGNKSAYVDAEHYTANDIYNTGTLNINGTVNLDGGIAGAGNINLGASSILSMLGEEATGTSSIVANAINVTDGAKLQMDWGDTINAVDITGTVLLSELYIDGKDLVGGGKVAFLTGTEKDAATVNTGAITLYGNGGTFSVAVGTGEDEGKLVLTKATENDGLAAAEGAANAGSEAIYNVSGAAEETLGLGNKINENKTLDIVGDATTAATNNITLNTTGIVVEGTLNVEDTKITANGEFAAINNSGTTNLTNSDVSSVNNTGTLNVTNSNVSSVDNTGNLNMEFTANKNITTGLTGDTGNTTVDINDKTVSWNVGEAGVTQANLTLQGSGHITLSGAGGITAALRNEVTGDTTDISTEVLSLNNIEGAHANILAGGHVTNATVNDGTLDINSGTYSISDGNILDDAGTGAKGTLNIGNSVATAVTFATANGLIKQKDITISEGSSLTANAGQVTAGNLFTNNGTYTVNGGVDAEHIADNALAVTGSGKTVVTGFVNQTSAIASTNTDADALKVSANSGLNIGASNLQAKTTNAGTLNISAGTLGVNVVNSGDGATTNITGNVGFDNATHSIGAVNVINNAVLTAVTENIGGAVALKDGSTLTLTGGTAALAQNITGYDNGVDPVSYGTLNVTNDVTYSGTATVKNLSTTAEKTLTNSGTITVNDTLTNAGIISISEEKTLNLVKSGAVANAGTISGDGTLVVGNGTLETPPATILTNNGLISSAVNIQTNARLNTEGVDDLTTPTSGVTGAIANAGTLNITNSTAGTKYINSNITGEGTLLTADKIAINTGKTVSQKSLNVTGTLTNDGTITVTNDFVNGGNGAITKTGDTGASLVINGDVDNKSINITQNSITVKNSGDADDPNIFTVSGGAVAAAVEVEANASMRLYGNLTGNVTLDAASSQVGIVNGTTITGNIISDNGGEIVVNAATANSSLSQISGTIAGSADNGSYVINAMSTGDFVATIDKAIAGATAITTDDDSKVVITDAALDSLPTAVPYTTITVGDDTLLTLRNTKEGTASTVYGTIAKDATATSYDLKLSNTNATTKGSININGAVTGADDVEVDSGTVNFNANVTANDVIVDDGATLNIVAGTTTTADVTVQIDGTTKGTLNNAGTIDGDLVNNGTVNNYIVVGETRTNGTIKGDVTNNAGATLRTNAGQIATVAASTISNDGTLQLDGGTITKEINQATVGNGTVEILGNVSISDAAAAAIKNNTITLSEGGKFTVTGKANDAGSIDLSDTDVFGDGIIAKGGTLDVQDGKTGTITLGALDLQNGSLNVAIDANFTAGDVWENHGLTGSADKIHLIADPVTGGTANDINISNITIAADPVQTEFRALIGDDTSKAILDLTATTLTGLSEGAKNLTLSYDSDTGYLTGVHSSLSDAIESTITTKLFNMGGDGVIKNGTGALTLGGTSLSITGHGYDITAESGNNSGIIVGLGKTLSITGTDDVTVAPAEPSNTVISGFNGVGVAAINNTAGGTVNLTDITMTGNTTDVLNSNDGANISNLTFTGTNSVNTISGTGTTNVNSGTTTVVTSLEQGTVNVGKAGVPTGTDGALVVNGALTATNLNVNTAGSSFTNKGGTSATPNTVTTLTNAGTVANEGHLTVTTFDNNKTLTNAHDSVLTATTINNSGSITNAAKGEELGSVAGSIVANIFNDGSTSENKATITNNGTITGNITNDTLANGVDYVEITNNGSILGNIDMSTGTHNVLTNQANGTIGANGTNTLINSGGTIKNTLGGLIKSAITNNAGTLDTLASQVTGGVTNDGTVRLKGNVSEDPAVTTGILGSNISNGANSTGETFILGTIKTPTGIAVAQATINVGELVDPTDPTTEVAGTWINESKTTDVPAAGISAANINVTANSSIANTGDIAVSTKLTNKGTVVNSGTGKISGAGTVDNDGTLTTTAAGITVTGGIDNDGTLNLNGNIDPTAEPPVATGKLGTAISSTAGTGVTNVTGTVSTDGKNVSQAEVVVGNNGTAATTNTTFTVANGSTLTTTKNALIAATGNVTVNDGNTLTLADGSASVIGGALAVGTADGGSTLNIVGNAALAATDGATITDGNLNLIAEGHDLTLTQAIAGAGANGVQVTVTSGNNGLLPPTTYVANVNAAITNAVSPVNVTQGSILALNDGGTITSDDGTGTGAQAATTIALGNDGLDPAGNGAQLNVNTVAGRILDNNVTATAGSGSAVNTNSEAGTAVTLANTLTGVDDVNVLTGQANIGTKTDAKTSTSDTLGIADLNIAAGATASVDTVADAYSIDNDVVGADNTAALVLNGDAPVDPATPTSADSGTIFSVAGNTTIKDTAVQLTNGQLNVEDGSAFKDTTTIAAAADATINAMDGQSTQFGDGTPLQENVSITLGADSRLKADVDVKAKTGDNFAQLSGANNVILTDAQLQNLNKIVNKNTNINLRDTLGVDGLTVSEELQHKKYQAMTPIRIMEATIDENGMMNIHPSSGHNNYRDFNPAVLATPVAAQLGGYMIQLNSYDEAFRNMDMYMLMTSKQRQALKFRNKMASLEADSIAFDPTMSQNDYAGAWFRPYASYEKVGLHNGPKVENTMYGSYFGGESSMKDLGNGWDGMWGAYVGYNGAHQHYSSVSMYENGGTLGLVGMAYKNNFFLGGTINAGASAVEADTTYGNDDFAMIMAGVAAKAGYNWELADGKFIIQPSLVMAYSFVNTFNYTNAAGVRINSDPLNAIMIEPGLKFIGNLKNGWQPYAGISVVANLMDRAAMKANDIELPSMSVNPYVKYGIGVRKSWGERFNGFLQTFLTSGGRNGIGVQGGFRWAIGAAPSNKNLKGSVPTMKETKVSLSSAK